MYIEAGEHVRGGEGGRFHADMPNAWLHLKGTEGWRGRWMRLTYSTGLFDHCVRPLIRFEGAPGEPVFAMNCAVLGRAQWIGYVPAGTKRISISVTDQAGDFSFALDRAVPVPLPGLWVKAFLRAPKMALTALGAWLVGSREEARHCLKFAALGTPLQDYDRWRAARIRQPDAFDQRDDSDTPHVYFLTDGAGPDPQSHANWSVHRDMQSLPPDGLIACLRAGDRLAPIAVGAVSRAARGAPEAALFYGDEDMRGADGHFQHPLFKPDYGPIAEHFHPVIGAGAFFRVQALAALGCTPQMLQEDEAPWRNKLLANGGQAVHLRRLLHSRACRPVPQPPGMDFPDPQVWPRAAIIIPSRDRAALLQACIDTLRSRTDYPDFTVIILDNGSRDAKALQLLEKLKADPKVAVISAPGPFNYAALCNQGARACDAPLLVFLNNDTVVTQKDWLKRLAVMAMLPDVGVVGAKLLYPGGRVQHAGVTLGMGDTASHLGRGETDGPFFLNRFAAPHEVSAVTGAVMAVARAKFGAGFDERLPVVYNDTDLCLTVAAGGFRTVLEPRACLTHLESASRGRPHDPFTRHAVERALFRDRWRAALRDDPYFHPALSLYGYRPALG